MTYVGGATNTWGWANGALSSFTLKANEQIISVTGRSGYMLDQITFTTNLGNTFGPFGGSGGARFRVNGPIIGFYGTIAYGCVQGLGFWTLSSLISPPPPPTPPSPPQPRPPYPSPPSPPPAPFPYRRSALWGSEGSGTTSFSDPTNLGGNQSCKTFLFRKGQITVISGETHNAAGAVVCAFR